MKKVLIALAVIAILALCAVAQVSLFSEIYGEEGVLVSGMATLTKAADKEVPNKAADTKSSGRNMDPGDSCGNGKCELNEFHYNCPEDC